MTKNVLEPSYSVEGLNPTSGIDEVISILDIGEEKPLELPDENLVKPESAGVFAMYKQLNEKFQSFGRVGIKDKVTFFQLLSIMIGAGVPLIRALYVLSDQLRNAKLRIVVRTMAQKVESGKTFSESMQDFHGIFNDAEIGMVRAAEASGKLVLILENVAAQAEKNAMVRSKVKGAMIYPVVLLSIMFGSVMVILGLVVPKLMGLFTEINVPLPRSTQILIASSEFVVSYYPLIIGGVVVLTGLTYLWKRTQSGKYHWDQMLIRIPIIGQMLRYMALARFTRVLANLLHSGVPIVKSLQIDADAVGNEVYRRRLYLAAEDVSRGIPLAENLTDTRFLFPEMVVSMVAVGEQTAELDHVAIKIADYYDAQVDQMASNMSKLLEPLMIVLMGVIVGGLIMAVMQPILSLMDVVGNI